MTIDEITKLQEYCDTNTQEEVFKLLKEGKTRGDIADILGYTSASAVNNIIYRVKRYAAVEGYNAKAGLDDNIPGFFVKGISDYKDTPEGKRWIKYDKSKEDQAQVFLQYIEEKLEGIKPVEVDSIDVQFVQSEGLTVYPVADAHVGVYTSEQETGVQTTLEGQVAEYKSIIKDIIGKADSTDTCVIALLGDFFHANDATNATPAHKHTLDVSARFYEVIDKGEEIVRYFVEMALQKHETVHIRIEEGNHDPDATKWFRAVIRALYRGNDRVITHDSAENFYGIKYGNTLHVTHHGHKMREGNVMSALLEKFRSVLNEIDHVYVHSGHWHNNNVTTKGIVRLETHATFAPNDDYAEGGGWYASKFATAVRYEKNRGGECGRATASIMKKKTSSSIPNI